MINLRGDIGFNSRGRAGQGQETIQVEITFRHFLG